ncbi:hypothetical protein FB45DRAFT_1116308 [Roridomyces roridus]|uniref:Uncharacterized protein n=1 Tax=Roridomyces roridus TaxID=1738132 RepID=A0AAD7CBX5_9AGAR|nr:hypothetical protein FB45DRAFT_1116308 [Roridomyces roridus]
MLEDGRQKDVGEARGKGRRNGGMTPKSRHLLRLPWGAESAPGGVWSDQQIVDLRQRGLRSPCVGNGLVKSFLKSSATSSPSRSGILSLLRPEKFTVNAEYPQKCARVSGLEISNEDFQLDTPMPVGMDSQPAISWNSWSSGIHMGAPAGFGLTAFWRCITAKVPSARIQPASPCQPHLIRILGTAGDRLGSSQVIQPRFSAGIRLAIHVNEHGSSRCCKLEASGPSVYCTFRQWNS